MKLIIIIGLVFYWIPVESQFTRENIGMQTGIVFNVSNDEFNSTTGLGLYFEPNYLVENKLRLGIRFEPVALAYGILTLPGGCDGSCEEGANFVLNNYLKAEYFLGNPVFGPNGVKYQSYAGFHLSLITHKRYIITSRIPGAWKDTRERVTNLGIGPRIGILAGRFDLSASFNLTGEDFRNYAGFNLGYQFGLKSYINKANNVVSKVK
jgi:hypothetical protein